MTNIMLVYKRLLVDLDRIGCLKLRYADVDLTWCIQIAPLLEKQLLRFIEDGVPLSLEEWPQGFKEAAVQFTTLHRNRNWLSAGRLLRLLRQALLFCYKAEHKHDAKTTAKFYQDWIRCQEEVGSITPLWSDLVGRARRHVTATLRSCDFRNIFPSHGPGAIYDRKVEKGRWSTWYSTIEAVYPYCEYYALLSSLEDGADAWVENVKEQIPCRVTAVPKDARGPRIICIHPAEAIWAQQGVRRVLERAIERASRRVRVGRYGPLMPWTAPSGCIHFDDQTVNGRMALEASATGAWATLDLKEASDRLNDRLVQMLFGRYYRYLGCSRATTAITPVGEVSVNCFAPMGNALTFPVQSLCFWAVCVASMEMEGIAPSCYVFGDDIIVPVEAYACVVQALTSLGLVVNSNKSFHKGKFRESCGVDAFAGVDVTPVRWKTTYDCNPDNSSLQAICDLGQRLRLAGYEEAAVETYTIANEICRYRRLPSLWPTNNKLHGSIAEYTEVPTRAWAFAKWHSTLHKYVTPCYKLSSTDNIGEHGWHHVLDSLSRLGRSNANNLSHGATSYGGKPDATRLKSGWTDVVLPSTTTEG